MNEKLKSVKESLNNINEISDIKSNPIVDSVLMSAIKSIPIIGDMIDSSLDKTLEVFQQNKERELIDVILQDKNTITYDMVNDVEFIMNFAKVRDAVRRLATNDKIKYFGNLIRNGYLSVEHINNDEFEEYFYILNNMSHREIHFLEGYYTFCMRKGSNSDEQFNYAGEFENYYIEKYNVSDIEVRNMFLKGVHMGFLYEYNKAVNIDKLMGEKDKYIYLVGNDGYCIDNSFFRFRKIVMETNNNISIN